MSATEYLNTYGPALLPSKEELSESYHMEGTYRAERNHLFLDESTLYKFLLDEDTLVLTDPSGESESRIYSIVNQ
jgi:hypothetical protein